ncbi:MULTISPECIES: hypothetical protein [Paenibacillus]|uniref:DUF4083 domain-containing protein n=1 Tax=Paenibacillus campinasensis TaxID=66347 RepID=A0ABW9SV11_9BACL|nr:MULTISPECIES: hypothetical protein [Paenibacillus]MUG64810.1 hypothetical protein [Paenibacillus campinasensis]PAK55517.1 hypothetical protein CHH75_04580 [Paenibacillus sp. 7541]
MHGVEQWLHSASHNYLLIAVAAVLFFAVKAVIGYITYRHYDRQLKELDQKIETLLQQKR